MLRRSESHRKTETLLLKDVYRISPALWLSREVAVEKEPGSHPLAWKTDWRIRRQLGLPLGTVTLTAEIWGELILPWCYWCWKVPFWNPPSSLSAPGAYPASQLVWGSHVPPGRAASYVGPNRSADEHPGCTASHAESLLHPTAGLQQVYEAGPSSQPGLEPALPAGAPAAVSLHSRALSPRREHNQCVQLCGREESTPGPCRASPTQHRFSEIRRHSWPTWHTDINKRTGQSEEIEE